MIIGTLQNLFKKYEKRLWNLYNYIKFALAFEMIM